MQRRRVGTLTLGAALIGSGIILAAARVNGAAAAGAVFTWWPLLLVMLGGEVLWHNYSAKDANVRLSFDIFSIFTVGMIVFCSLGVFTLTEIGVVPRLQAVIAGQSYSLQIPVNQRAVAAVRKAVISSPRSPLVIRTGTDKTFSTCGKATVTAASLAQAESMLDNVNVDYRQEGDILYVSFSHPYGGGLGQDIRVDEFTVTVPGDLAVEVDGSAFLRVYADQIKADWLIDAVSHVEIRLSEGADVRVATYISEPGTLSGNVDWKTEDKPEAPADIARMVKRTAGNGKYEILVLGGGSLTVNRLD